MALLTTLVALGIGAGLGLRTDGSVAAMLRWKPALAIVAPVALAVQFALSLGPAGDHWWATILDLGSMLALMAFCFANLRVGGMVVLLLGLALNTLPILVNGETPTSRSALVNAGLVTATAQPLELDGPRSVATSETSLRWLGEILPISATEQVLSIGDLVVLAGAALVVASLLRGRTVRRGGPMRYTQAIAPLGRGPVKRRGPGLHPSRMQPPRIYLPE